MAKLRTFQTIIGVTLAVFFTVSCGSDKKDDKDTSSATTYTWADDISSIVVTDCSSAGCHGTTSPASTVYQNNEKNFKAVKTQVIARLALSPNTSGYMPQGQPAFDDAKKQKLIDFLNQ